MAENNSEDDKTKAEEEPLVFYYNREERIKSAPTIVKSAYDGTAEKPPSGIFEALVHTKSSRFMLLALAFALVVTIFIGFFGNKTNQALIKDVSFEISAFSFNDVVYTSLHYKRKDSNKTNTPIKIIFSGLDADGNQLISKETEALIDKDEDYIRTTFNDYDIISIKSEIITNENTDILTCNVVQQ